MPENDNAADRYTTAQNPDPTGSFLVGDGPAPLRVRRVQTEVGGPLGLTMRDARSEAIDQALRQRALEAQWRKDEEWRRLLVGKYGGPEVGSELPLSTDPRVRRSERMGGEYPYTSYGARGTTDDVEITRTRRVPTYEWWLRHHSQAEADAINRRVAGDRLMRRQRAEWLAGQARREREAEYANWLRALTNDEPLMSPRDELEYLLAGGG